MFRPIDEMKRRARGLHARAKDGDPDAWRRLARLPELRRLEPTARGAALRRRHALATVAREVGFDGWSHAVAVLKGRETSRFGALLYAPACSAHGNIWFAGYADAQAVHREHGGYLLPYKDQYVVVDRHFLQTLGVSPEDPDWQRIGGDWVRPASFDARLRLTARVVQARLS